MLAGRPTSTSSSFPPLSSVCFGAASSKKLPLPFLLTMPEFYCTRQTSLFPTQPSSPRLWITLRHRCELRPTRRTLKNSPLRPKTPFKFNVNSISETDLVRRFAGWRLNRAAIGLTTKRWVRQKPLRHKDACRRFNGRRKGFAKKGSRSAGWKARTRDQREARDTLVQKTPVDR